jgi:hypothetical protein
MRLVNLATADLAVAGRHGLPQPVEDGFHGVAIHWVAESLPRSGRRRKLAPTVPVPTWMLQRVRFGALNLNRSEEPPADAVTAQRMVRHAYALAASQHPIPSDTLVFFEVCP